VQEGVNGSDGDSAVTPAGGIFGIKGRPSALKSESIPPLCRGRKETPCIARCLVLGAIKLGERKKGMGVEERSLRKIGVAGGNGMVGGAKRGGRVVIYVDR